MPMRSPWTMARTAALLLCAAALALGLQACDTGFPASAPTPESDGGCESPVATLEPDRVRAGAELRVEGAAWAPCNDEIFVDETARATNPSNTSSPVTVAWVQSGNRVELDVIEPTDGTFALTVSVPADASPGAATIELTSADYPPGLSMRVDVDP